VAEARPEDRIAHFHRQAACPLLGGAVDRCYRFRFAVVVRLFVAGVDGEQIGLARAHKGISVKRYGHPLDQSAFRLQVSSASGVRPAEELHRDMASQQNSSPANEDSGK